MKRIKRLLFALIAITATYFIICDKKQNDDVLTALEIYNLYYKDTITHTEKKPVLIDYGNGPEEVVGDYDGTW
jgi:hypothetical protein